MNRTQPPSEIRLRQASACLELDYGNTSYTLDAEFLRVHSPSAEVTGHGRPIVQYGKKGVWISAIEPVGNYGVKLVFSDGHDTGIYTWPLLQQYCQQKEAMWQSYLDKLARAGLSREVH